MPEERPSTQAQPTRRSGLLRGLAVSCAVLALLVALLELVPRVAPIPGLRPDELDPFSAAMRNAAVGPHPYLAYANLPNFVKQNSATDTKTVSHNSLGFRGPETTWAKPDGVFRILCLGGSSTYGFGPSSNEATWPARLAAHLVESAPGRRVEAINAGCRGYSTFESMINLSLRGVDFQPDLVVVYHTINDMRCALYPGVVRDNTHWRAVWPVARKLPLEAALEGSITYQAWRRYGTSWWTSVQDLGNWVIVDNTRNMELYGDHFAQPTDVELGIHNFRRNLMTIVATSHGHGAEALLVTQGTRMTDFDRAARSAELQKATFERLTTVIGEVANLTGATYCDARSVLEAEAARQRQAKLASGGEGAPPDDVFTNEVHLTDAGADLLARTIAARILELGLLR